MFGYDNIVEKYLDQNVKAYDELVFKTFEQYGYSKDWIIKNRDRVTRVTCGSIIDIYATKTECFMVDNIPLFDVEWRFETFTDEQGNTFNAEWKIHIKQHKG